MLDLPRYQPTPYSTPEEGLKGIIEFLSAYIEELHGGYARYVDYDGTTLTVELGGACHGCGLAQTTLQGWIAGTIRQYFPDIEVEQLVM